MAKFSIPATYAVRTTFEIEADSAEQAQELVAEMPAGTWPGGDRIEGTLEVEHWLIEQV